MKSLRKNMAALASAGLVIAVAVQAQAAFVLKSSTTVSASAAVGGTPTVAITSVEVHNRAGDALAGSLAWTGATPGGGWLVSDQYIKVVTNINTTNGGLQVYTDNTGPGASPTYTGAIGQTVQATPAGLVNTALTSQKLPTAWRASTFTVAGITSVNPNAGAGDSFLWFFHADKAQVRVPDLGASKFGNGDPYVTVYVAPGTDLVENNPNNDTTVTRTTTFERSGLHFAAGDNPPGQMQFGGFNAGTATTYIYTEADFSSALSGSTYSTNKLILEAFSL